MKKHLLFFSLLFTVIAPLFAQEIIGNFDPENPTAPYLNTVTTADPFLLIAPDARAGGMGDMGVATSPDNYSQHHNPAKYVCNEDIFGIGIAYSPWLRALGINDIHLLYLSSFWKITDNDAIAASLRFFTLGEITFTNKEGQTLDVVNPNEFSLDFTYSRRLTQIVSMALTPRFIYSNLAPGFREEGSGTDMQAGKAFAVDISLFVDKEFIHNMVGFQSSELMFGFNISNIGNKVLYSKGGNKREFLPCNLRLGLTYAISFDNYSKLAVGVETGKLLVPTPPIWMRDSVKGRTTWNNIKDPYEMNSIEGIGRSFGGAAGGYKNNPKGCFNEKMREIVWSVGLEYSYRDILFVRAGTFLENQYKGNRKFATVGVGVKYNIFAIDVSYLFSFKQSHPLENTLRFALTFMLESFDKDRIKNQGKLNRN
jgi:hypothetical protein